MPMDSVGQEFRQVTAELLSLLCHVWGLSWEDLNSWRWLKWLGIGGSITHVSVVWATMTHLWLSKGSPVRGLSRLLWASQSMAAGFQEGASPKPAFQENQSCLTFHDLATEASVTSTMLLLIEGVTSLLRFKLENHWIRWSLHALPALKLHESVNWH